MGFLYLGCNGAVLALLWYGQIKRSSGPGRIRTNDNVGLPDHWRRTQGLLAAIHLGRYCRTVRVIDAGESRAAKIPQSHDYPGFFGIATELLRRLSAQAQQFGAPLMTDRVAIALWSANSGMKAILDALNVVYEEKEKRGFFKLNLVSLCFTLAAIAALLLAVGAVVVMPIALNFLGLQAVTDLLLRALRWPVLLALIILGLAVLYRFGPSRREPRWQWISVGSI